MKAWLKSAIATALLGGTVACASPAAAQGGVIAQLFDRADYVYDQHGYSTLDWERQSLLRNGQEESFSITLTGGTEYSLIGVCDADCENLDIYVTDEKGIEITKDVEDDDYPVVYIKRGGTFKIRVVMTKCTDAPCEFGLKAFKL